MRDLVPQDGRLWIHGARCAFGSRETAHASLEISGSRVTAIRIHSQVLPETSAASGDLDLSGFLLLPGLVNAHDHLQFALFPRLGNGPYESYIDWGEDIHRVFRDVIATHHAVPKSVRLWWGGIRNVLCGVTTVCHHDPLWPELQKPEFPVHVVERYGWAHSPAFGGDLRVARSATPPGSAFIVHACEGRDTLARDELAELEKLGLLDASLVVVHGLALDAAGVAALRKFRCSLIVCPSSNEFLFGKLPDRELLSRIDQIALGNDSPLTAAGDLLDEIRFASQACGIPADALYHMVTQAPAAALRLSDGQGTINVTGPADLIAVRDTGIDPADRLVKMSMHDVEFVMIAGRVQVASEAVWKRLAPTAKRGMNLLYVDGVYRWVRAPIESLFREAEGVLGSGLIKLGGRAVHAPTYAA